MNDENLGEDLGISELDGSLVLNLFKNSPAAKGGLLPGDYITRINTSDIKDSDQLTNIIGNIAVVGGSVAESSGLRKGDLISRVDSQSIETVNDFYKQLNSKDNDEVTFRLFREGREFILGLVK